jgi:hypothetical protein
MKVNIFKKLIRDIIREELEYKFSALEKKINEVLVKANSYDLNEVKPVKPTASTTKNSIGSAPKTNNKVLNSLLEETANSGDWKSIDSEPEVKSVQDNTSQLPDHLAKALTKDYSDVMEKVEEKVKFRSGV